MFRHECDEKGFKWLRREESKSVYYGILKGFALSLSASGKRESLLPPPVSYFFADSVGSGPRWGGALDDHHWLLFDLRTDARRVRRDAFSPRIF